MRAPMHWARLRWALAMSLGLMGILLGTAEARGPQVPKPEPTQAPAAKPATAPRVDMRADQLANQAREELELMQAQLDAKKALLRIGEARLEQAKRWETHYKSLLSQGKVTEDRYLTAQDDVLMLQAHLAGEKAQLKLADLRFKHAQRRVAYGELPTNAVESRLIELEQRLGSMELDLDRIQHEVGRLRRLEPGETPFKR